MRIFFFRTKYEGSDEDIIDDLFEGFKSNKSTKEYDRLAEDDVKENYASSINDIKMDDHVSADDVKVNDHVTVDDDTYFNSNHSWTLVTDRPSTVQEWPWGKLEQ